MANLFLLFALGLAVTLIIICKHFSNRKCVLTVLMYHRISSNGKKDALTLDASMLSKQFEFLNFNGYTPVLLSQVVQFEINKKPLPPKPVLITFDDGYRDNYTVMYPLLKKYGMAANIFLVPSFISNNTINYPNDEYLNKNEILSMDPSIVEFGLHSYKHSNYSSLSIIELNEDIIKSKALLKSLSIPFQPCIAFPYGAYPKKKCLTHVPFFKTLSFNNITLAFRIGNRLNPMQFKNPLLLERLDINGNISFAKFTSLLKNGKSLFA